MTTIMDGNSVLATVEDGQLVGHAHPDIEQWFDIGVPSLIGVQDGDTITEEQAITERSDPFFLLAILDEVERRGWHTSDEPEEKTLAVGDKPGHPFRGNQWEDVEEATDDSVIAKPANKDNWDLALSDAKKLQNSKLTEEQNSLLADYCADAFEPINDALRRNETFSGPWDAKHIKEHVVPVLDEAFKNALPLSEVTFLFRGFALESSDSDDRIATDAFYESLNPGDVVSDHGYVSTSPVLGVAADFGPILFTIKANKGTKALVGTLHEKELILPRDSKFKVVSKSNRMRTWRSQLGETKTRMVMNVTVELL